MFSNEESLLFICILDHGDTDECPCHCLGVGFELRIPRPVKCKTTQNYFIVYTLLI